MIKRERERNRSKVVSYSGFVMGEDRLKQLKQQQQQEQHGSTVRSTVRSTSTSTSSSSSSTSSSQWW